ncbi:MAG: alanine--tRNA ligase [Burkholderiaceae bacterium]|nr:alanine--tRNA ligase [Burkholderiaceae bacterium]
MQTSQIRQTFLKFFESKGHTIVHSSPVIPGDDPTLLFTNAGMNQFKDVFLGFDKRAYTRATTAQKCIRAGGKHNDLDNVGYTARHHTFFEMLGNFSFGDYFKRDAIKYAWELLTEHFKLPPEKLTVTVYAEDDEAYDIWHDEVGVPAERIVRIGDNKGGRYMSDNFWMMGDTGPCGPCSEIFYDHGPEIAGGPPGSPDEDGDRFIEIWNNVFMQFNRDEAGVMHKLPKPSVDTGMGLERIAAVLQGVHTNYDIDLFQNLLKAAKAAVEEAGAENVDLNNPSLKVIADHIRACAFSVADGIVPGNEGRTYVLRRICRRAIRHGYKLGARGAFFAKLARAVAAEMGDAYPEVTNPKIEQVLAKEEQRFAQTINQGMQLLEGAVAKTEGSVLDGEVAFKLHDTYGFPVDLTADVCRERDMTVDMEGFERAMQEQRDKARAAAKFKMAAGLEYEGADTVFTGYTETKQDGAKVLAVYVDGEQVEEAQAGDDCVIVLDTTPFYGESGGQIGDTGTMKNESTMVRVIDTQKIKGKVWGHHAHVAEGSVKVGDVLNVAIDEARRAAIMRNHSVAHLLHYALREVLGTHVQQKGSWVGEDVMHFDFSHNEAMTAEEIARVEDIVNEHIIANTAVVAEEMSIEDAKKTGALMLFGEKYGDRVRVVKIGPSTEFCGGTHVARTGDIGSFKLLSESGIAAGIRRVEVTTGMHVVRFTREQEVTLKSVAAELKTPLGLVTEKAHTVFENVKSLEKQLAQLKSQLAVLSAQALVAEAKEVNGVKLLVKKVEADSKALRDMAETLRDKIGDAVVVLGAVNDGKVQLVAGVSKSLHARVKAGEVVNTAAQVVGGKGGGKPDLAMAGGADVTKVDAALAAVAAFIETK